MGSSAISRWLSWRPGQSDFSGGTPGTKPSKPSPEGGFEGFETRAVPENPVSEAPAAPHESTVPDDVALAAAVATLNREGVRRFQLDGVATIGIWKCADTAEVRVAIGALYSRGIQVVHLEDRRVPAKYKARKPKHIAERETVDELRISWHEWKARMLNEIFETQGVTGRSSKITAEDVRRGEAAHREGGE